MSAALPDRKSELLALRERVQKAAHDLTEADDDSSELSNAAGDQHLADHASEMLDHELDASLEENADEIVREIDEALARIDAGSYGICARCGQEIPAERLDAVPYAVRCVDCKRLEERR